MFGGTPGTTDKRGTVILGEGLESVGVNPARVDLYLAALAHHDAVAAGIAQPVTVHTSV